VAFPLHKAPLGLLELFRLRTLGANPNQFSDTVQPVTDVTDFYGADLFSAVAENGAAGAIGVGLVSAVSLNSRRYLGFSGTLTVGAAAGTYLNLALGFTIQGVVVGLVSAQITPIAAGVYRVAVPNMRGLVLPPGHALTFNVNGNAAGVDHTPQIRYAFNVLDGR